MLLLLKPWRNIIDLKGSSQSWEDAYNTFMTSTSQHNRDIVEGIQFFHSCQHAAELAWESEGREAIVAAEKAARLEEDINELEELQNDDSEEAGGLQMSKAGLEILKLSLQPTVEDNWGRAAVIIAQDSGILPQDADMQWEVEKGQPVASGSGDDLRNLLKWQTQMDNITNMQSIGETGGESDEQEQSKHSSQDRTKAHSKGGAKKGGARVEALSKSSVENPVGRSNIVSEEAEAALPTLDISELRPDQLRVYEIVLWHLEQSLGK